MAISSKIFWSLIFALILTEYLLFRSYVLREIANYYPPNFDQSDYLNACYLFYVNALKSNLFTQLMSHSVILASSYIFCFQAAVFFKILGASRLSALTINFIYFGALQLLLVKVVKDVTQKYLFAILGLGLLLSANTIYFWAGNLTDFRIDFMAFCLFGILITCIIKSNIFLNTRWTIISSVVACYLVLLRYITISYILGTLFFLLSYFLISLFLLKKKHLDITIIKTHIKNIFLFLISLILSVLPFLWSSRDIIYNYYAGNHFFTNEKNIRAIQEGVTNFISDLIYYPKSILINHIGFKPFLIMLSLGLGSYAIYRLNKRNLASDTTSLNHEIVFLFLAILTPVIILTFDLLKSPVVGNIVVIPFIWLVLMTIFNIYQKSPDNKLLNLFLIIVTTATFFSGLLTYCKYMHHRNRITVSENFNQMTHMYEEIGNYFQSKGQNKILFSTDTIKDFLNHQVIRALYYEKHGVLLDIGISKLGGTIFAIDEAEAKQELQRSDVFVVSLTGYPSSPTDYPFNIAMIKMRPHLLKLAETEFKILGDYHFNHSTFRVFVR